MYDFDSFEVVVKDNDDATDDGTPEGTVLEEGNIKESGYLDISDISFEDHQKLDIEVRPTVLNDSPWADDKTPFVATLLDTDEVQYCFKTRVKDKCNIKNVSTISSATITTETDTLNPTATKIVPVNQPENVRCFQDLKVTPNVSKTQVANNEEFTYTAQVNNKANTDDNNLGSIPSSENPELAGVEITIPNGVNFVSATPGAVREGNKLTWGEVAVAAQSNKDFSVTVKTPASLAMEPAPSATALYAATVQQQLTFQSRAIFSGDDDPSDNVSTTSITFNNTVPDSGGGDSGGSSGGQDNGGTDGGSNSGGQDGNADSGGNTDTGDPDPVPIDEPVQPERTIVEPSLFNLDYNLAPTAGSLTPRFIAGIVPPSIKDQTEAVFKFVNSAVSPIPSPVAVALPYGTIAFLIAFASIYAYQGVQASQSRKQMAVAYKRFKRTEELRRNYVDLTSHYLNTPIATMQSSVELLAMNKELPVAITEAAKQRIGRIVEHARLLLSKADELTQSAKATANVIEPVAKKRRLFSFGVIIPVVVVLVITAIINALFVWADKYSASTFTLVIQALYFVLSALAMLLAFNVYRNQKYASSVAERELGLEKKLTQSQAAFIANTSKTIEGDLVELEQMTPVFAKTSRGAAFVGGFKDLKSATVKLDYLNRLTNHTVIPTLPNQTIKTLTNDVIESLKAYSTEKRVTIETNIQPGLTALVDEDGLRQILYSTLHNGVKFNAAGGRVVLSIVRLSDSQITITVQDNGQGIPDQKIDQLFTPFGRGTDSKEYNFEGFGLDLYMNKLIAEQCGGSISLESTEGAGTTVTVRLPS
jgi:signal transduction histidine kinase